MLKRHIYNNLIINTLNFIYKIYISYLNQIKTYYK